MALQSELAADTVVLIPARYAARRLPGKPLLAETGLPLIVHVAQNARRIRHAREVRVATDDRRIAQAVEAAGFRVCMTRPDHASGTDRLAEAAEQVQGGVIVNLQGDEPAVDTAAVDRLIERMHAEPELGMGTLGAPLRDAATQQNPAAVKVVCDRNGIALYFSRAPIPCFRDGWNPALLKEVPVYRHIGVYAYRREFLKRFAAWPRTPLETAENLEQLRALEHGARIPVVVAEHEGFGIDTPEEYRKFVAWWRTRIP